ncbi:MAG: STAS domain-containing protein [Patescibacteria group bacterium]
MSPCTVTIDVHDTTAFIRLSGSVIHEDVPSISQQAKTLLTQGCQTVIFDFSKTDRVNSNGIAAVISTVNAASATGAVVVVHNPNDHFRVLLITTKLISVLNVSHGTDADALACAAMVRHQT